MPGHLIVFEGIGGSGKSSVMQAIATELTKRDHAVTTTRQPGGTPIGQKLREIVLNPDYKADIDATAQLFLYAADRYINIERIIRPALAAGHIVLCDRYDHSTRAYQAAESGDPAKLETINQLSTGGLVPERTYWFDVEPTTARDRTIAAHRAEPDRFDLEKLAFWQRVRDAYAKQAATHPDQIVRVDAKQPLDAVIQTVIADILKILP